MQIPFNQPSHSLNALKYVSEVIASKKLSGNGDFSKRCVNWLRQSLICEMAVITPSCTAALEMAMILADINPGDEVVVPSFTFTSTATAPLIFGGIPVFVDIDPVTMNVDTKAIEAAITPKTKVIMPMHYAGVSCDMETIMGIADRFGLLVIADAAQAIMSAYKGKPTASWGHMSTFSFHETKNIGCGEGGALIINDRRFKERAEIVRDKGTNRQQFLNGEVNKYRWIDKGSSYLLSELDSAYLFAQFEEAEKITEKRLAIWNRYHQNLEKLESDKKLNRMIIPHERQNNAHIYFLKLESSAVCQDLLNHLKLNGVQATTHYVPLHSSPAGLRYGRTSGLLPVTEDLANRILRLPLFADMTLQQADYITEKITSFYKELV